MSEVSAPYQAVGKRVFGGTLTVLAGQLPPHVAKALAAMTPVAMTGREAAMVSEIVTNAAEIRLVECGTVCHDLTPRKTTLRVMKAHQSVHVQEVEQ